MKLWDLSDDIAQVNHKNTKRKEKKAKMTFAWQFTCLMTFAWQFTCLNNFGINHRYSGIGSPLFLWKKNSPFFSFFLVFLWLTCAISSDKSHNFISSEKSHYFLQFAIQPLPRSILILIPLTLTYWYSIYDLFCFINIYMYI
jgi:hypothetical protein